MYNGLKLTVMAERHLGTIQYFRHMIKMYLLLPNKLDVERSVTDTVLGRCGLNKRIPASHSERSQIMSESLFPQRVLFIYI